MKRPAIQFYPNDWRGNEKLRRCTDAARGVWMDVMCTLHSSEEYGVVRYPLAELARAAGVKLALLRELVTKGVLKGGDADVPAYVHRSMHAGRVTPVQLLDASEGPMWYCSRFVRDEWSRSRRGSATRFDSTDNQPSRRDSNGRVGDDPFTRLSPDQSPIRRVGERQGDSPGEESGERLGDGASSSSSASALLINSLPDGEVPTSADASAPTPAGLACKALRAGGILHVNPSHPHLLAAIDEGATPAEFESTAREAVAKGKTAMAYVIATIRNRRRDATSSPSSTVVPFQAPAAPTPRRKEFGR